MQKWSVLSAILWLLYCPYSLLYIIIDLALLCHFKYIYTAGILCLLQCLLLFWPGLCYKEIFNLNGTFYKDLKNPSAKSWLQILPCDGNVLSGFQMASYHAWEMCLADYRSTSHLQQFKYQQSLFARWSLFGPTPAFFPGFQPAKLH